EPRPGLDDLRPRRAVEPERVGERGAPAAGADVHELRRARHRPLDGWTAAEAVVEVIGDEEVRAGPAEEAGGVGLVGEKLVKRIEREGLDAGVAIDRLARDRLEGAVHHPVRARVAVAEREAERL